jgi:membrane AbrB-like protein
MTFSELLRILGPVALAIGLGLVGWKVAERLRFPAAAMIGPMILVAVSLSLGAPRSDIPDWFRISVQSVIGGYLGRRIDRAALGSAYKMLPAIAVSTTWYVVATAAIGYLVARWARIDLSTALLSTVPGGVAEMTALAITAQADVAFVATMQALRVLATNFFIPVLARRFVVRSGNSLDAGAPRAAKATEPSSRSTGHWIFGLAISLAGGFLFSWMNFPAGGVIGSMLTVAVLHFAGFHTHTVPRWLRNLAYIGLGISVGFTFDENTLERLWSSAGMLAFATAATLASSMALALIIRRIMRLDYRTAMLACAPGGLSMMAVIAEETGGQSIIVSLFHLVRIVWIVLIMPVFLRLLA